MVYPQNSVSAVWSNKICCPPEPSLLKCRKRLFGFWDTKICKNWLQNSSYPYDSTGYLFIQYVIHVLLLAAGLSVWKLRIPHKNNDKMQKSPVWHIILCLSSFFLVSWNWYGCPCFKKISGHDGQMSDFYEICVQFVTLDRCQANKKQKEVHVAWKLTEIELQNFGRLSQRESNIISSRCDTLEWEYSNKMHSSVNEASQWNTRNQSNILSNWCSTILNLSNHFWRHLPMETNANNTFTHLQREVDLFYNE